MYYVVALLNPELCSGQKKKRGELQSKQAEPKNSIKHRKKPTRVHISQILVGFHLFCLTSVRHEMCEASVSTSGGAAAPKAKGQCPSSSSYLQNRPHQIPIRLFRQNKIHTNIVPNGPH